MLGFFTIMTEQQQEQCGAFPRGVRMRKCEAQPTLTQPKDVAEERGGQTYGLRAKAGGQRDEFVKCKTYSGDLRSTFSPIRSLK